MLVVGAKGFAKEVLEVLHQLNQTKYLVFYDDITADIPDFLYNKFSVLKNIEEAQKYLQKIDNRFTIGIGNPILRKIIYEKFIAIGGQFTQTISHFAKIGNFGNTIEPGCNIMTGTVITNDVTIKKGTLINLNCTIGHDSILGQFVELSPGVHISGNCKIGDYSVLGTNSTVLPNIIIGKNVIVGAGSVVTKDVPDNCLVVGTPALIKKERPPLKF